MRYQFEWLKTIIIISIGMHLNSNLKIVLFCLLSLSRALTQAHAVWNKRNATNYNDRHSIFNRQRSINQTWCVHCTTCTKSIKYYSVTLLSGAWGSRTNLGIKTWMTMMICCWLLVRFDSIRWNRLKHIKTVMCTYSIESIWRIHSFIHLATFMPIRMLDVCTDHGILYCSPFEKFRESLPFNSNRYMYFHTFKWGLFISRVHVFVIVFVCCLSGVFYFC